MKHSCYLPNLGGCINTLHDIHQLYPGIASLLIPVYGTVCQASLGGPIHTQQFRFFRHLPGIYPASNYRGIGVALYP